MPLPPHAIHRLSDHFGQYTIDVKCRACGHSRSITPTALARIFGWDAELARVVARLRCSRCSGKACAVEIGFSRPPRKWRKNPS